MEVNRPVVQTPSQHENVILYAHRGSSVLAPENTIQAFELAKTYGADVMEIDVRLSRDGQVIVIHDERVDRTCNGHGRVRDLQLSDLKQLNAGYHFTDLDGASWRNRGIKLSTLTELFEQFPDTPINIDIKDQLPEAANAVASVIEQCDRILSSNVGSFHFSTLTQFRRRLPEVTTAAGQSEVAKLYFQRGLYKQLPFEYLQIPTSYIGLPLATPRFIQHAKKRNIKIVYWTINELKKMQLLINLGASGFVTDRVDIAAKLLGRR